MSKISRRDFIQKVVGGSAAIATTTNILSRSNILFADSPRIDRVSLGKTGIEVSRLAFGTGTNGWQRSSNQTRMGMKKFLELAERAYDRGIVFLDSADLYGSHTYIREALKIIPRDKVVILSKIWTESNDWYKVQGIPAVLDRFREEIGTDYIDIVLLHCQVTDSWLDEKKQMRDDLSAAKEKGVIGAHGVSCHKFNALKRAAASDWVEVILVRINNTGNKMDASPAEVMPVIKRAHDRGAGIIGMKLFGAGDLVTEAQRQSSLEYVLKSGNVDAMTIGFQNPAQIDDTINRVNRIVQS
jgi:aryl-alcohol dehydrogenase-like predicted oxidoreductase